MKIDILTPLHHALIRLPFFPLDVIYLIYLYIHKTWRMQPLSLNAIAMFELSLCKLW